MNKLIFVLALVGLGLLSCRWKKPMVGLENGRLKPCPATPNCVSSQEDKDDLEHTIAPLELGDLAPLDAMAKIEKILLKMPRTKIEVRKQNYLHVSFTTRLMRYVDDVEILIDEKEKKIHLRSASRVGHSDMGVNRKRLEEIKKKFLLE